MKECAAIFLLIFAHGLFLTLSRFTTPVFIYTVVVEQWLWHGVCTVGTAVVAQWLLHIGCCKVAEA